MNRHKAAQRVESIYILYFIVAAFIGSYVMSLGGSIWSIVLGLAIIFSTIPFTYLSNVIWEKIQYRWKEPIQQLTIKEVPVEKPKLTFPEFIALYDSEEKENPNPDWAAHWRTQLPNMISSNIHMGDCTRQSCPCNLCMLETWLREYREYYFNKEVS
jgi:hypothetical protein